MSEHIEHARILMSQTRFVQAEQKLRQALTIDPEDTEVLSMLSHCLCSQDKFEEATETARRAVALAPDWCFTHYTLGFALYSRDLYEDAETAVLEALRIDPEDPDYYFLLGMIYFEQRQWRQALQAAEQGLSNEADHDNCINLRSMALVKLGRKTEAEETIQAALARDPENGMTQANLGWTLIEKGDYQRAMEHFREALRLDPNQDWARQGIVKALKAHNPLYRPMLKYFLWMSKLAKNAGWGIIIGAYILFRVLRVIAGNAPQTRVFIYPLLALYIGFAILTWIADPLFDLLLRLHPIGRHALTRAQITASNIIMGLLIATASNLVVFIAIQSTQFLILAVVCFILSLPVSGTFRASPGRGRVILALYTCLLAALAAIATIIYGSQQDLALSLLLIFAFVWFAFTWVANYIIVNDI